MGLLGDWIRAWGSDLSVTEESHAEVARLLGFTFHRPTSPLTLARPSVTEPSSGGGRPDMGQMKGMQCPASPEDAGVSTSDAWLEQVQRPQRVSPQWLSTAVELPEDLAPEPASPEPLIAPMACRTLLRRAASIKSGSGPLDSNALALELAHLRVPARLPRQRRLHMPGVELFIDRDESMSLFFQDQQRFREDLEKVIGRSAVGVRYFRREPSRIREPVASSSSTSSAARFGPVAIVLTNFGCVFDRDEPSDELVQDWRERLDEWSAKFAAIVTLTPVELTRLPEVLRAGMTILAWDRGTTAADLERLRSRR